MPRRFPIGATIAWMLGLRSCSVVLVLTALACSPAPPPPIVPVAVTPDPLPARAQSASLPVARDPDPRSEDRPRAVDPEPPRGWTRCAAFVNTGRDDVDEHFFDPCFGGDRLRVRVFDEFGRLEEDVAVDGIVPRRGETWPSHEYLGRQGSYLAQTHWGGLNGGAMSALFAGEDGKDACMQKAAPGGPTLGSGHANKAIIAPGATGYDEYRVSCGGPPLPDRTIVLYR